MLFFYVCENAHAAPRKAKTQILGWLLDYNWSLSNTTMVLGKRMNWLHDMLGCLSIMSVIWELTKRLQDGIIPFFNLSVSLQYFQSQSIISTHIIWCACAAQPAMTISMKRQDSFKWGWNSRHCLWIKSISTIMKITYSKKLVNSSYLMKQ